MKRVWVFNPRLQCQVYEGPSLAYCEKGSEAGVMAQAGKDLQA